jgi:hypothetical protein
MVHTTVNHGQCCLVEKYLTSRKTQKDAVPVCGAAYGKDNTTQALVGGNYCHDVEN